VDENYDKWSVQPSSDKTNKNTKHTSTISLSRAYAQVDIIIIIIIIIISSSSSSSSSSTGSNSRNDFGVFRRQIITVRFAITFSSIP
jgi:hypothetical protein